MMCMSPEYSYICKNKPRTNDKSETTFHVLGWTLQKRQFPQQKEFQMMIEGAGFEMVSYRDYTLGICSLHDGFKL